MPELYSPTPFALRYLRQAQGLSQVEAAVVLAVPRTQLRRWEGDGYRTQVPPKHWRFAEHLLALGDPTASRTDDPVVYVLAHPTDDDAVNWITDQENRVLAFTDGGLAASASKALRDFGYDVHALPVRFSFLEAEVLTEGRKPLHADLRPDGTPSQQFVAVRTLIFEHLASVGHRRLLEFKQTEQHAA